MPVYLGAACCLFHFTLVCRYSFLHDREEEPRTSSLTVSVQLIERRIYLIRGHRVMIDEDLEA